MTDPYTPKSMEAARSDPDAHDSRLDGLKAEASAAVAASANTLRGVRERYRELYAEAFARYETLRDDLDAADRRSPDRRPRVVDESEDAAAEAARAAEAGAADARARALRRIVETTGNALGGQRSTLAKLDVAERTLSRTWLFLEHGDASLVTETPDGVADDDLAMRIVEAQEAERTRLAQEIHDGPAQALTNAIFQAEFIERVAETDPVLAAAEIKMLRDLLRRELANVRDFINQLRPPLLDELGLDGAIEETASRLRSPGVTITSQLEAPADQLDDRQRTVVLRVTQEALQNVRKHAEASMVVVSTAMVDDDWTLEVRDNGRGFDIGAVAARGPRNFGLQFMRERAELIGARFDVRSRPDGGTVVRLAIPRGARAGVKENG